MPTTIATILVVDDDCFVRESTKLALERNGYVVRLAADGGEALAELAAGPSDIVLLDIMMPNKEGIETLLEIKRNFPDVIVFAMSASGGRKGHDFLSVASKFGANGILQKPFSPADLLSLIRACPPRQENAAAASSGR